VEIEVEVAIEAAVEVIGLRRLRWKVEGRRNDATEAKVFLRERRKSTQLELPRPGQDKR